MPVRGRSLLRAVAVALVSLVAAVDLGVPSAGAAVTYLCKATNYSCDSTGGYHGQSVWGYPLDSTGHNCTNYAAYRLSLTGMGNPGNLGDAGSWAANASNKGFPVDGNAAVGAIAQYDRGSAYAAKYGHVAYVTEVGSGYIVVEEDNWSDSGNGYLDRRKITVGASDWPSNFIHFHDTVPAPTVSGLVASGDLQHVVHLAWAATGGAAGFRVYRNGVQLGTAATTSYDDFSVPSSTRLQYQVSAVSSGGAESDRSPAVFVVTRSGGDSGASLSSRFGPTYCRRVGGGGSFANQYLQCTVLRNGTWSTAQSPGGIDWGYDLGWAWVSSHGNPAYCRRVGGGGSFANQFLQCTVFDGTSWSTSQSPGGIDWGYPTGWSWITSHGNPAYCRRVGGGGSFANNYLQCTTFDGSSWTTSQSPGGIDWGYDKGWSWTQLDGDPTYCRLVGAGGSFSSQYLQCTMLRNGSWSTSQSPGGIDWGYDLGWSWTQLHGKPTYCRRVGAGGSFANNYLQCTTFNGSSWSTAQSPGGVDWGYDLGWSWFPSHGNPTYCRRVGAGGSFATQYLQCTVFDGSSWRLSQSPGGIDWGYDLGWSWITSADNPTYCRRVGSGGSFESNYLQCTVFDGASWTVTQSPGGIDWGYDLGVSWLPTRAAPRAVLSPSHSVALGALSQSYGASGEPSEVVSYDVRYRRASWNGSFGGYGYPASWQGTRSRTVTVSGPVRGSTYCFSARVRSTAGDTSSWSAESCTAAPLDERSLAASSGWTRGDSSAYYGATISRAASAGRTLSLSGVRAHRLWLVATTCSSCGSVGVYWNGRLVRTISLNASSTSYRQMISVGTFSGVATGNVVLKSTGPSRVYVDGLAVSQA